MLGESVAREDYIMIGGFLAVVVAIALVGTLKQNIWILIPLFYTFGGKISIFPLPFSVSYWCKSPLVS